MERKLRTALAIEHQRRVVAEGRAQQIASLSPVEQAMLAAWARTARLLHAPKPRCLCCGGPLFWMCIVPWLLCVAFTGGSPLVLIAPAPPAEADVPTLRAPAAGLLHTRGTPTRKKPVLIVPGMTSTALEVWRGTGCYKGAHRRRLWSFRESLTLAVRALRPRWCGFTPSTQHLSTRRWILLACGGTSRSTSRRGTTWTAFLSAPPLASRRPTPSGR